MENTLSMVEDVIDMQENNLNENRQQYQDWEKDINQELNSQNAQYKELILKFVESYFLHSKNHFEQAENFIKKTLVLWLIRPET